MKQGGIRLRGKNKEKSPLTFLEKTKEGKYAIIEKSSLPYARIKEETVEIFENYYYGYS